jgi:alpha-beta hydrolase superfamily lysophospholipase
MFVVHGEQDLVAMPDLARDYVSAINAPQKAFVLLPGAGHETSAALMRATHQLMLERVRPLAALE